jgi:Protein of unknown function (DUF3592)
MLTASALLWTRIAAGVCLFLVANFVTALWKLKRQVGAGKFWSKASGKIVAATVSRPQVIASDDNDDDNTVEIRYRYRVGDKDFESTRVKFGGHAAMSQIAADQLVARYPQGAGVDVYYDPKTPSHAVLEPGNKSNPAALIVFLVVFVVISTVLIAHSIAGKVLTTPSGVPLFVFVLPLFAIMIAVAAFVQYVQLRRVENASASWPASPGRIMLASVVMEQRTDDEHRIVRHYRPEVQFSYSVGGREFHGDRWKWGWTALYSDEASAKAAIAKYASGAVTAVFYNPEKPEEAILEPGNRGGTGAQLLFGAMFGFGGILMLWAFSMMGP